MNSFLLAIVLISLSTSCSLAEDLQTRPLYEGAVLSNLPVKGGGASVVTIDPKKSIFKLLVSGSEGQSSRALLLGDYYRSSKAKIIISGGYMASFSPPTPLGLVKVDGTELSRPHKTWIGTGMVCAAGQQVRIAPFEALVSDKASTDCIQSGPLLVQNGVAHYNDNDDIKIGEKKLVDSVQEQAFICIDGEQKIKLGVSDPIRLDDFTHILVDKLHCQDALRLSGGPTAGLETQFGLAGNGELPLHNVIAVFQKTKGK